MSIFEFPEDLTCRRIFKVTEEYTAKTLGSGGVSVLATPVMIGWMELTAWECVERYLPEGYTTVGTHVDVRHLNPAPLGVDVVVEARLQKVEGRKLVFKVSAYSRDILIGDGMHERYIVELKRFKEKIKKLYMS